MSHLAHYHFVDFLVIKKIDILYHSTRRLNQQKIVMKDVYFLEYQLKIKQNSNELVLIKKYSKTSLFGSAKLSYVNIQCTYFGKTKSRRN